MLDLQPPGLANIHLVALDWTWLADVSQLAVRLAFFHAQFEVGGSFRGKVATPVYVHGLRHPQQETTKPQPDPVVRWSPPTPLVCRSPLPHIHIQQFDSNPFSATMGFDFILPLRIAQAVLALAVLISASVFVSKDVTGVGEGPFIIFDVGFSTRPKT